MKVECPSCARQVDAGEDVRKGVLLCPACEAEIPYEAKNISEKAVEEILPGIRPGLELGAYEVIEFLGSGGMAVLVKGRQLSLNRIVAIKILPRRFARNKLFIKRFDQEAAAMASLNHHNIVNVIDRGREGDIYYIVMEYVEGQDLKKLIAKKRRLSQTEAITICQQALAGLSYAHDKGIIHRDIKPGNIMISNSGIVKVADFGLAHLAEERTNASYTHTGQMMGTLKYMSPEQLVDAKSVDARADIYSIGVVLYEMLTGLIPVGAFKLPSELAPELDPRLDDIILQALRSDPKERFRSAQELSEAMQNIIASPSKRPTSAHQGEFHETDSALGEESGLTACRKCGRDNSKDARVCEGCGSDLSYMFEKCPECSREVRFDVSSCPGCGYDISTSKLRKRRQVMKAQRQIKDLMSRREFDRAVSELRKLKDIGGIEYEEVRRSASFWLDKLEKTIERRNQQIHDAAQRMFAEADYEKALGYLNQLPKDYKNTGELIGKAQERLSSGREMVEKAQKAAKEGRLDDALNLWEKAAELWPRDARIKNNILQLKMRLGNRNLVRRYLDDAKAAAEKKNFPEAIDLCKRASALAPDDESVIALMEQLRKDASSFAPSQDTLYVPGAAAYERAKRRKKIAKIAKKAALFFLTTITILSIAWLIIHMTPTLEERAEARMQEAIARDNKGELEEAAAIYETVLERYPQCSLAAEAGRRRDQLRKALNECNQLIDRAYYHKNRDELKEAGEIYLEIIRHEDYSRSVRHIALVRDELRKLRQRLINESIELERNMRPGEALELLETAREMVVSPEVPSPTLLRATRRISRLLDEVDELARETELALENGQIDIAESALKKMLTLLPTDERLNDLIDRTLAAKIPPDGMVYVSPGNFIIRFGSDGADIETKTELIRYGYYIGALEVTNRKYAEFINDTAREAPPHWNNDVFPAGEENHPVVNISYKDAVDYAAWAGQRLPVELEWVKAAGGEEGRRYPWGDEWDFSKTVSSLATAPVGAVESDISPTGCLDMGGNVSEWTSCSVEGEDGHRIIMGGSFIGPEHDRPMPPVFGAVAEPPAPEERRELLPGLDIPVGFEDEPQESFPLAVTGISEHPVASVLMRSNPMFTRPRISGSRDRAGMTMFLWLAEEEALISASIVANRNGNISGSRLVRIPGDQGRDRQENVEFITGCEFIGWKEGEDGDELVMIYRDPAGLTRELAGEEEPDEANIASMFIDLQSNYSFSIKTTMGVNFRRSAPEDGRYVNVGFRTAKTPELMGIYISELESIVDTTEGEN